MGIFGLSALSIAEYPATVCYLATPTHRHTQSELEIDTHTYTLN